MTYKGNKRIEAKIEKKFVKLLLKKQGVRMPEENLKPCIIYTIYRYIYCSIYKTIALLRINSHTRSACNQSTPIKSFCIIVDFARRGIIQQMHKTRHRRFCKASFLFQGDLTLVMMLCFSKWKNGCKRCFDRRPRILRTMKCSRTANSVGKLWNHFLYPNCHHPYCHH